MINVKREELLKQHETYLLLYESERIIDDDVWIGIYTDIDLLIVAYEKLARRNLLNMPIHIYKFKLNAHNEDPKVISIEELKAIAQNNK